MKTIKIYIPVYDPMFQLISQPPRAQATHQETNQPKTRKRQKPNDTSE